MYFSLQNKTLVVANMYDRCLETISLHGGSAASFILCHVCGAVALGVTPPRGSDWISAWEMLPHSQ